MHNVLAREMMDKAANTQNPGLYRDIQYEGASLVDFGYIYTIRLPWCEIDRDRE